jgi:RNA polymerase sigma-70 factor (ECF subfamily)
MAVLASKDALWSELMAQAQDGDPDAYHRLLTELSGLVTGFVRRRLANDADVEDVVQEVLLSIHTARKTYDPRRPFSPWFFAIVRRRYFDFLRKASRRAQQEVIESELDWHRVEADREEGMGLVFDLERILEELPEKQRMAFRLTKIKGLSSREAAERSGMSESAVKVSVHRAQKSLRKRLESL